jgi:hypothetical protein
VKPITQTRACHDAWREQSDNTLSRKSYMTTCTLPFVPYFAPAMDHLSLHTGPPLMLIECFTLNSQKRGFFGPANDGWVFPLSYAYSMELVTLTPLICAPNALPLQAPPTSTTGPVTAACKTCRQKALLPITSLPYSDSH